VPPHSKSRLDAVAEETSHDGRLVPEVDLCLSRLSNIFRQFQLVVDGVSSQYDTVGEFKSDDLSFSKKQQRRMIYIASSRKDSRRSF